MLVIEQDTRLRDALAGVLGLNGFDVTTVRDAEQARRVLFPSTGTIGLITLDLADEDAASLLDELANDGGACRSSSRPTTQRRR